MADFITIREHGETGQDGLFPLLDDDGDVALAGSETCFWTGFSGLELEAVPSKAYLENRADFKKAWELPEKAELYLSNQRLVYVCRKFDKGSTWIGGGAAVVLTAGSKLLAARRRSGKSAVGQVRHEWIATVIARRYKALLASDFSKLTLVLAGSAATYRMNFTFKHDDAFDLAEQLARAAAKARLDNPKLNLDGKKRSTLRDVAERGAMDPRSTEAMAMYKLPGNSFVKR